MRIAAFQRHPVADDIDRLCDRLEYDLRWATSERVDLALFPEAYLLGHSYVREVIARRARHASDHAVERICGLTRSGGPTIVIGAFEMRGTKIMNSAIVIAAGSVIGRYAKAYPNEPGVIAGTEFPVFAHAGCRFGINICNDANHPAAAQRIADQDSALILYPLNNMLPAPTADQWRSKSIANLQARARQTGCWVASSDVTGTLDGRISHGCTAILNPDGEIVARVAEGAEGVVAADLPGRPAATNDGTTTG